MERNDRVREARQKYLHDMATFREDAEEFRKDAEEFRKDAENARQKVKEGQIGFARTMLQNGEPIEKVLSYTGLTKEEIESMEDL
ncbi:MAG: hypothetical protein JXR76_07730 [Deltaproteobacteria bacterium]|nr:hypothetical protein [Deltaproteobacteria bacterium]